MIINPYCVFDFETGSKFAETTQPIQIAAVMVDPIKLEIIEGSEFESLIMPVVDEEICKKLKIDMVQDEALQVNGKKLEDLMKAPSLENVWSNFTQYVKSYQKGKSSQWNAPVPVGYNIAKFDMVILSRICKQYGPWDEKNRQQKIFHPMYYTDVFHTVIDWFENWNQMSSYSQSSFLEFAGISAENAHDALVDVKNCTKLFIKFKKLYRNINNESAPKIKWK